jgi:flagellar assembly protein FliH
MAMTRKFLFDVSFDVPEPEPGDPAAEPRYGRNELEAARNEAYADGESAGRAAAVAATETRIAGTLDLLGSSVGALIADRASMLRGIETQALELLRAVLQKAVPALCRKDPLAEIEALVAASLEEVHGEPRLVLRVNDALFDAVQARLAAMIQAGAFAGKTILLADAALAEGDARVEWADGGAERDTRRLATEIDAIFARALTTQATNLSQENVHG